MLYPQYFIDDLKNRADLVRIIQPYAADLKKKGANWMACCPFHQEKTPSFSVNPSKGFYKCFGCGKGGTAFNFLMEMEGLNFPEAVQRVAEMSGVMLPQMEDDQTYERTKKIRAEKKQVAEQVIELNQVALEFWEAELKKKNKHAKAAQEYLKNRGISEEIQKKFHIGYSPDKWDALLGVLRDFGADDKLIEQSGLVSVKEESDRTFDRFRGRIMFPVLDVNGKPVAFGARAIDPKDEPKYLNSPETPAYVKGEHLYGLFQSKEEIRRRKFAILVEGYLDLIALAQFGVMNVAASLGTAFTTEQARMLGRFTKSVVINYDGDSAGIKAARRAIEHLLPQEFDIKVLVLPDGKDPDDFIRENGRETYDQLRGRAEPYLAFALKAAAKGRNIANARQKAEAVEEFLPIVSAIRNNLQKRETFDQSMSFFHIEDSGIKRQLWNAISTPNTGAARPVTQSIARAARPKATIAERKLLELLVHDRELRETVLPIIELSDYENLAYGELFQAFIAIHGEDEEIAPETLMTHIADDEELLNEAQRLLNAPPKRNRGDAMDEVLAQAQNYLFTIRAMAIDVHIESLKREANLAQQSGNFDREARLALEQLDLQKLRNDLQRKIVEL